MKNLKFRVQRLFLLAVVLKFGLATLSYILSEPLWLGLIAPMAVMVGYIVLGYYKRDADVSAEKFADSCYYLGFLFTIGSIILCLFDVPKMAQGAGLFEIAVRFGAAMISTLLGMTVRVYLVSFSKDAGDAVNDVEAALVDASRAFMTHIQDTVRNLRSLDNQIIDAAKSSVAGVQLQVEALGRNFSVSLTTFYEQLMVENRTSQQAVLAEVQKATENLSGSMEQYGIGMQRQLVSLQQKVEEFGIAVEARLSTTTFPDDFFALKLAGPMDNLQTEAQALGERVSDVAQLVAEATDDIAKVLKSINGKTRSVNSLVGTLVEVSEQQQQVSVNMANQSSVLEQLIGRLDQMQITVGALVDTFQRDEGVSSRTTAQLDALLADSQNLFGALRDTAQAVDRGTEASQNVSRLVGASTEAMQSAAQSSLTVSANFLDAALSLQLISQSLRQREDDQHLGSSGLLIQPLITSGVTPTFSQEKPEISATSNQRLTDGSLTSPHA